MTNIILADDNNYEQNADMNQDNGINILDIGTGSGCILLSILKELKRSRGLGIDISHKAIFVAKKKLLSFK